MNQKARLHLAALALVVWPFSPASAQPGGTYSEWVNACIAEKAAEAIAVAASTRSPSKQAEASTLNMNTSSLVDTSSASDLVAIALNIAGLTAGSTTSDERPDATSVAGTASAYMLYTAALGRDPLDPSRYCEGGSHGWAALSRRLSVTLGFDDDRNASGGTGSPILAGAKLLLFDNRNVCGSNFDQVRERLREAAAQASRIFVALDDEIYARYLRGELPEVPGPPPQGKASKADFLDAMQEDPAYFDQIRQRLGPDSCSTLLAGADVSPFVLLDKEVEETIARFQRSLQASASFLTSQRDGGADEYRGEAILTYGLSDRLIVNGNASYDASDGSKSEQGGRMAAELQFQPFLDNLRGPLPLRFSIAGQAMWMEGQGPTYEGQLKVNLPIPRLQWLVGVQIPLSVTISNRTELVQETTVLGMVGFTVDTAQVLQALMVQ